MIIAVLGTGSVGRALGLRWAQHGHQIVFGSRDPQGKKAQALLAEAAQAVQMATIPAAVAAAPIVTLATPWAAVQPTLESIIGWQDKILIDCTNPIAPGLQLALGTTTSGGEQAARWAPGARVVKAFNTTGYENMMNPVYDGQATAMFICGDDPAAKAAVGRLAEELGFEVVDAGPLSMARMLEPLAILWIYLASVQGLGRNIAFRLVRREPG
jgi:8-hydroxy-5-deazaflavin:NADPH oxidoreductase